MFQSAQNIQKLQNNNIYGYTGQFNNSQLITDQSQQLDQQNQSSILMLDTHSRKQSNDFYKQNGELLNIDMLKVPSDKILDEIKSRNQQQIQEYSDNYHTRSKRKFTIKNSEEDQYVDIKMIEIQNEQKELENELTRLTQMITTKKDQIQIIENKGQNYQNLLMPKQKTDQALENVSPSQAPNFCDCKNSRNFINEMILKINNYLINSQESSKTPRKYSNLFEIGLEVQLSNSIDELIDKIQQLSISQQHNPIYDYQSDLNRLRNLEKRSSELIQENSYLTNKVQELMQELQNQETDKKKYETSNLRINDKYSKLLKKYNESKRNMLVSSNLSESYNQDGSNVQLSAFQLKDSDWNPNRLQKKDRVMRFQ